MHAITNTGGKNVGCWNTGDYNEGDCNPGYMNEGNFNTGDYNAGSGNTGSRNQGDYNTGDYNQGAHNTGDWNLCSHSAGIFCTTEDTVRLFDKPSTYTYSQWSKSRACQILRKVRTACWIDAAVMTSAEKREHPEYIQNGGYLRTYGLKEACLCLWQQLTAEEREEIKRIPNFDGRIFEKITGIPVRDCRKIK